MTKKQLEQEQNLPVNAQKWVNALRSGKYRQARGALRAETMSGPSFCCLGVACEISGLGEWRGYYYVVLGEHTSCSMLTRPISDWLSLDSYIGGFKDDQKFDTDSGVRYAAALTALNDTLGWDFNQIADYIEYNWSNLKKLEDNADGASERNREKDFNVGDGFPADG